MTASGVPAGMLLAERADVTAFWRDALGRPDAPREVEFLSGGVSSIVVRVVTDAGAYVVKQALPQLRVEAAWYARPERSLIEARCAGVLQDLVPGSVPAVVATVPAWHAFVMASAPTGSETWKWHLMRGEVDEVVARQAGSLLGRIHATSAERPALATAFDDRSFFDELRIDPYLRSVAAGAPRLRPALDEVIGELLEPGRCLVHGDFSPKNLLLSPAGELLLVDHEVAHWGHPAFDVGFVTCHLLLKSIRFRERADAYLDAATAVLNAYAAAARTVLGGLGSFAARMTGALLVARVDGKSPVEYLTEARDRELARALGRDALLDPPTDPWALVAAARAALADG